MNDPSLYIMNGPSHYLNNSDYPSLDMDGQYNCSNCGKSLKKVSKTFYQIFYEVGRNYYYY